MYYIRIDIPYLPTSKIKKKFVKLIPTGKVFYTLPPDEVRYKFYYFYTLPRQEVRYIYTIPPDEVRYRLYYSHLTVCRKNRQIDANSVQNQFHRKNLHSRIHKSINFTKKSVFKVDLTHLAHYSGN